MNKGRGSIAAREQFPPRFKMADHLASFVEATFTAGRTKTESYGTETPNGAENFRHFQISEKMDKFESLTRIFEINFREFFVPFDFLRKVLEILVEWNTPKVSKTRSQIVSDEPKTTVI